MPLEPKLADLPRIRGALRLYQVASIITGVMLLLLCAEMIMKYAFGLELELGGPHGFLAFVPVDTVIAVNLSTGILIALGGIIPFLSFFLETRIGREVRAYLASRESEPISAAGGDAAPSNTPDSVEAQQ